MRRVCLYIVRHAESTNNESIASGRLPRDRDPPVTDRGQCQIQETARVIAGCTHVRRELERATIVSSTLQRAVTTRDRLVSILRSQHGLRLPQMSTPSIHAQLDETDPASLLVRPMALGLQAWTVLCTVLSRQSSDVVVVQAADHESIVPPWGRASAM